MEQESDIYHFHSISHLMRYLGLPAPGHPLIALINYAETSMTHLQQEVKVSLDFYKISFKPAFHGRLKYGQGHYDFEEGGLAFLKPQQIVFTPKNHESYEGYALYFHPDLIRQYPLGQSIGRYGFFSYSTDEALFLSAKEQVIIQQVFGSLTTELESNIDTFSQDVLISHLELLLNYSNRFYNRQFITRKAMSHETLSALDALLMRYLENRTGLTEGLPTVHYVADELHHSQRYLSDLLRSLTGMNTQQYIQNTVIEYAKNLLSVTSLSVSEIAYQLGFGHPQSFSKFFKTRTSYSPLEFRRSFN